MNLQLEHLLLIHRQNQSSVAQSYADFTVFTSNDTGVSEATVNAHVKQICSVTKPYYYMRDKILMFELILSISIGICNTILTRLMARNSQQGALPE